MCVGGTVPVFFTQLVLDLDVQPATVIFCLIAWIAGRGSVLVLLSSLLIWEDLILREVGALEGK